INRFLNFPPNPPPSPPHTNKHTCQGETTEGNVDGKPNHVNQNEPHFESTDNKDEIERDRKSPFSAEEPKLESDLSKSDIFIENVSSAEELVTLNPQFDDIIAPDVIEEIVIDDEVNNDCDNGALLPQDSSTPEKCHELMTSENGEFPSHLHIEDIRSMAECADELTDEKLPTEKKDQDPLNSSAQGRQLVAKFQPLNADGYNPTKQYIRNNRDSSLPLVIVSDGEDSVSTGVGADSDVLGTKY
uniref:Uncharacterized protein n=1 Tax=Ciona savignyi TaxID=51511 RepID=H2Y6T1_CIOSA